MKNIVFIILFFCTNIYSQNIAGKRKVISYEDEIIFYHKEKDSILFKDETRKEEVQSFKEMSELLIFPITYTFYDKGIFIMSNPNLANIEGKYKLVNEEIAKKNNDIEFQLFYFRNEVLYTKTMLLDGFVEVGLIKTN